MWFLAVTVVLGGPFFLLFRVNFALVLRHKLLNEHIREAEGAGERDLTLT